MEQPRHQVGRHAKKAIVSRTRDGSWRLFYEYAAENASHFGLATAPGVAGPWTEQPTPFEPRADWWDNWHLSIAPCRWKIPECTVMFYNGATIPRR